MSLDTLMNEAARLDSESQRKLIGYLVSLRAGQNPDHQREMGRRINDQNPEHWLTLDQLDAKLAQLEA